MREASVLDTEASFTRKLQRQACFREGNASRPSGTLGTGLEVMMSPSQLDEDSQSLHQHHFGTSAPTVDIYRQSLVRHPVVFYGEPHTQAMAIERGRCRRRVLWRLHVLHGVLPCHLVWPHTLSPWASRQVAQHSRHQSSKFIWFFVPVRSGRSVLLDKDYCFEACASSLP